MSGWTPERIKHLTIRWLAGATAAMIAEELGGITRNAVIGQVYRLGLSKPHVVREPKPPRKRFDHAAIAAAYASGMSRADMERQFECSFTLITRVRKAAGLPARKPRTGQNKRIEAVKDDIIARYLAFEDASEIARAYGVKRNSLTWYMAAWGVRHHDLTMAESSATVRYLKSAGDEEKAILAQDGAKAFLHAVRANRRAAEAATKAAGDAAAQEDREKRRHIAAQAATKVAGGMNRRDAMLEARRLGATLEDIGQAFGITRERVRQITTYPAPSAQPGVRSPAFDYAGIAELYRSGLSMAKVAERVGCHIMTVHNALVALEEPRRRCGPAAPAIDFSAIKSLHRVAA